MKHKIYTITALALGMLFAPGAYSATTWSAQDFDLYSGDFNGDGKTDILYVAKDASKSSGIAVSDASGAANTPWQSWPSNYLGIPWSGKAYNVVVADFNGDGKADVFLQRQTPGDHYLLLTEQNGKINGIAQSVSNTAMGLTWSADQHQMLAGDFNGDGCSDLFLQSTSAAVPSAVVAADGNGMFTSTTALQTLYDGDLGFNWSTKSSVVSSGDFNGDGLTDLLVQARPKIVMIDYDVAIPVPVYGPNMNGVASAQNNSPPFQLAGVQQWSRYYNGVDWSPLSTTVVVGNFDGVGGADVLLQARSSGRSSYLLTGNASGAVFTSATALATNVTWSADSFTLLAGDFDGTGVTGIYGQALTSAGTNYVANTITGGTVSAATHDPGSATGVVAATAVGHTVGSFAVTDGGAASYSVGIVVPPGIAGIQPQLSINYDSGGGNGLLGVGWSLGGFSEIERCAKSTLQDGVAEAVALSLSDRFCLDGNKLRLTNGTYGAAGSTYQTEIESFAIVTAQGAAGNGPEHFIVETKQGLRMEYGNSANSRIEAVNATGATTTPHTWALNKVSDPHGNTMTLTYEEEGAPNGAFRPLEINYTANASAGVSGAYRVKLQWEARPASDTLFTFAAGSATTETKRLNRIETQYLDPVTAAWRLVRRYQLSYNAAGATPRSRLTAIQECDGDAACLAPTMISWYDGTTGFVSSSTSYSTSTSAVMDSALAIDLDGDARTDLVYPQTGSPNRWYYMRATTAGTYAAPVQTSFTPGTTSAYLYQALPIDYSVKGRQGLLTGISGDSNLQILEWNPTTNALVKTPTNIAGPLQGNEWVGDFNGDGSDDYMYVTSDSSAATFYLRANTGMSGGVAQFGAATVFYTFVGLTGTFSAPWTARSVQADFNGDGRTDLIVRTNWRECEPGAPSEECTQNVYWTPLLSTGTAFATGSAWHCVGTACLTAAAPLVGDFNGDGYMDGIVLSGTGTKNFNVKYGHSRGMTSGSNVTSNLGTDQFLADYDGDDRTDLLYLSDGVWYLRRATQAGFEAAVATNLPASGTTNSYRALDIDGDGQTDFGYNDSTWQVRKHRGTVGDLVKSIANGYGDTVSVVYAPMTDSTVYTKGSGTAHPKIDVAAPIYLVKQYSTTDGKGGTYSINESYAGARAHVEGIGYLGFESRQTVDTRTNIRSVTTFSQDYPNIGAALTESVYQPGGSTLISQTSNTPAVLWTSTSAFNERRFPYVSQSLSKSFEVGGSGDGLPVSEVTTTTTLDANGNATNVSTTTVDKTVSPAVSYLSSVTNTYDVGDATCWRRGFMTRQQMTKTVPGYAAQTRTVDFVKDTTNSSMCRLYQEIVEPGNAASSVTTTIGYDTFGHPSTQTVQASNVASRVTSTSYGTQGIFPVSVTNALNQTTSATYDYALGVSKTATDANGVGIHFDYDGFGRKVQETRADGTKSVQILSACTDANGYCGDERLRFQVEVQELDASSNLVRTSRALFDMFNRQLYAQSQTASGAYTNVATNYDSMGRAYQQSQPYFTGSPIWFATTLYDLVGRPTQESRPISESDSGTQTTTYVYNRLIHAVTDAGGRTTTQEHNALGQVVKMTNAASGITTYEYDPFGNLKKTIDPAGNQITNTFNIRGFKTATSDPDMGAWQYTYYPTGELWTQTNAKGQVTTFQYDAIGRPLTRTEVEGTTYFTYGTSAGSHNIGKLASVSSPGGFSESYVYDSLGRLQDATTIADSMSFVVSNGYNATTGMLETTTYPTSTSAVTNSRFKIKYEYEYGALKRTRDFNTPATIYWERVANNASGQIVDEQLGNGLHTYSAFDAITGLPSSFITGTTAQVQNLTYQWDKTGNLTQRKDVNLNLTEDFFYDSLNRLDYSRLNGSTLNVDPTYDASGNITALSRDGVSKSYDYGTQQSGCTYYAHSQPHAARKVGTGVQCYDANGNMTRRSGSDIIWYSYNLPNRIDYGSNYSQFYYGADRSRYKQVAYVAAGGSLPSGTETTLYVAGLFERVTKPSGVIEYKHYIPGGTGPAAIRTLRSNSADDTRYLHKDHLGSVDTITNESGGVVARLSFDAFGKRRDGSDWVGGPSASDWGAIASITHRGFTSHEQLDNVDLVHMNGRVYDPNTGRFIQADPFIQAPLMSESFNRYSYVVNNPLSLVDPSGYSWLSSFARKVRRHANAISRFLLAPTPKNFFESIKAGPWQKSIDRYVMTHQWAYSAGQFAATVATSAIGGWGGAVWASYYSYLTTGSATAAVRTGAIAFATQWLMQQAFNASGLGAGSSAGYDMDGLMAHRELYADTSAGLVDTTSYEVIGQMTVSAARYSTANDALGALTSLLLSTPFARSRLTQGEWSANVERLGDHYVFTKPEFFRGRMGADKVHATHTAGPDSEYLVHTHPRGYDIGPSVGVGDDFDALGALNIKRGWNVTGVLINSKDDIIFFKQIRILNVKDGFMTEMFFRTNLQWSQ